MRLESTGINSSVLLVGDQELLFSNTKPIMLYHILNDHGYLYVVPDLLRRTPGDIRRATDFALKHHVEWQDTIAAPERELVAMFLGYAS